MNTFLTIDQEETGKMNYQQQQNTEVQHAKIMASFVPDEIIYSISDYSIRKYDAVLVLGDVSGKNADLKVSHTEKQSTEVDNITKIEIN